MSGFVHRAFFCASDDEWLDGLVPFVRGAAIADEPMLVAIGGNRIEMLRSHVRLDGAQVEYLPMEEVGRNPGRIISAWHDFADRHDPARRLRGVGEPVWPGRRPDEVSECQHHEQLLNLAFAGRDFDLMCPYDTSALSAEVVDEAFRSHPYTGGGNRHEPNPEFALDVSNSGELSPPPARAETVAFDIESLRHVRQIVGAEATRAQLDGARVDDFVLAVSETATNSVQYGDGGVLTVWLGDERITCQISDHGQLTDPLVGRRRPPPDAHRGRGVWLAHQLCDLVQIRTQEAGTTVRLTMELRS